MWCWSKVNTTCNGKFQHLLAPDLLTYYPHHQLHTLTVWHRNSHFSSMLSYWHSIRFIAGCGNSFITWKRKWDSIRVTPLSCTVILQYISLTVKYSWRTAVIYANSDVNTLSQSIDRPHSNSTDNVPIVRNTESTIEGVHGSAPVRYQVEGLASRAVDLVTQRGRANGRSILVVEGDSK